MMTAAEVSAVLFIRGRHPGGITVAIGPQRIPARLVEALRDERGLGEGERVAVVVPLKRGVVSVVVEADA